MIHYIIFSHVILLWCTWLRTKIEWKGQKQTHTQENTRRKKHVSYIHTEFAKNTTPIARWWVWGIGAAKVDEVEHHAACVVVSVRAAKQNKQNTPPHTQTQTHTHTQHTHRDTNRFRVMNYKQKGLLDVQGTRYGWWYHSCVCAKLATSSIGGENSNNHR